MLRVIDAYSGEILGVGLAATLIVAILSFFVVGVWLFVGVVIFAGIVTFVVLGNEWYNYARDWREISGDLPETAQDEPIRAWKIARVQKKRVYSSLLDPHGTYRTKYVITRVFGATPHELESQAKCYSSWQVHTAPEPSCTCGFYAWKDRKRAFRELLNQRTYFTYRWLKAEDLYSVYVILEVELAGDVIEYFAAYRAEWQRILTVNVPEDRFSFPPIDIDELRNSLGVDVVEFPPPLPHRIIRRIVNG